MTGNVYVLDASHHLPSTEVLGCPFSCPLGHLSVVVG